MKDINFEKANFRLLVSSRNLGLPGYQRKYSWGREQWEELIQSIIYFIDKNKNKEKEANEQGEDYYWDIYFIGDIILQKVEGKNSYEVIDGQQRIITIFIILFVIYEFIDKAENFERSRVKEIKREIENFSLSPRREMKLELRDEKEKRYFRRVSPFFDRIKQENYISDRYTSAKKFFSDFLSSSETANVYSLEEIYESLIERFVFLIIKPETEIDDGLQELFLTLNSTGLDLNISDLLRNLFIDKLKKTNTYEINETWEKIEDNIIISKSSSIKQKMEDFLLNFWIARFTSPRKTKTGRQLKISRTNLYELFRNELKKDEMKEENAKSLLEEISDCAIINKNVEKPNHEWWKTNGWREEKMFNFIENVKILGLKQIISLIFTIHSLYKEASKSEQENVINNLNILLIYMFRLSIIKGKAAIDIHNLLIPLIKGMKRGQKINENEETINLLTKEFNETSTNTFYQELNNYRTKQDNFWKFIFRSYYKKKYNELTKCRKISIKLKEEDFFLKNFEVEHLVSKKDRENLNFSIDDFENIKYWVGNITLLRKEDNGRVSNKLWIGGKRDYFLEMGEECFLSWENWSITNKVKITPKDIKDRGEKLLADFKILGIFEKGI